MQASRSRKIKIRQDILCRKSDDEKFLILNKKHFFGLDLTIESTNRENNGTSTRGKIV